MVAVGEGVLVGPAGLLVRAVPPLGRLAHWYRAGAVAALLLVPLVASQGRGWRGPVLATLVLLDSLVGAPRAWPLQHAPPPDTAALERLKPGAMVVLPRSEGRHERLHEWRYPNVMAQVGHGHPIADGMMGIPIGHGAHQACLAVRRVASGSPMPAHRRSELLEQGFRWVVLHPPLIERGGQAASALERCFGEAVVEEPGRRVYDLRRAGPGCPE
jgi:hypothetical protein